MGIIDLLLKNEEGERRRNAGERRKDEEVLKMKRLEMKKMN